MGYELSQRFKTRREPGAILNVLEEQLGKVAKVVVREGDHVTAKSVAGSLISVGKNSAVAKLTKKDDGYVCVADINYTTSVGFWLAFIILMLAGLIPAAVLVALFYLGKKPTREAIERVLTRVKDEVED